MQSAVAGQPCLVQGHQEEGCLYLDGLAWREAPGHPSGPMFVSVCWWHSPFPFLCRSAFENRLFKMRYWPNPNAGRKKYLASFSKKKCYWGRFSQNLSCSLAANVPLEDTRWGLQAQKVNQLDVLHTTDRFLLLEKSYFCKSNCILNSAEKLPSKRNYPADLLPRMQLFHFLYLKRKKKKDFHVQ